MALNPVRLNLVSKVAAFFDLDKTIIATSASAALSRPFYAGGLVGRRDIVRSAYAHFLYELSGADVDQTERMRQHLSNLVDGWDVEQVRQIVDEAVYEVIDPYVYVEAVDLIAEHREIGHDVVIVSASGAELVTPIAALLGVEAKDVIASQLRIEDGKYTSEIDFYAYGENKASAIREMAVERGYDLARCYAYSDSITDAPMLGAVGHGFVVNPNGKLRRLAAERGWGVLQFSRPAPLREVPVPPKPALAIAGGIAAATVGALAWRSIRRR
ncbi:MAG: HAD-IB family hydrolase [Promicromonosporaceae bacterium]|nr:HAD-IB family hydrolase [Promicromonosporaceae bacterium]